MRKMWNNLTNDVYYRPGLDLGLQRDFHWPFEEKWKRKKCQYNNKTKFIKDNITLLDYFPLSPLFDPFYEADIHVHHALSRGHFFGFQSTEQLFIKYVDTFSPRPLHSVFLLCFVSLVISPRLSGNNLLLVDWKKRSFDVRITHARPPLSIAIGVQKISNCRTKWNGIKTNGDLSPCPMIELSRGVDISTGFAGNAAIVKLELIAVTIRNKAELNAELGPCKL